MAEAASDRGRQQKALAPDRQDVRNMLHLARQRALVFISAVQASCQPDRKSVV